MGFWLSLDNKSDETKWGVMAIKFYFGSEQACADAKAIFDGRNANLIAFNPSGQTTHPLTMMMIAFITINSGLVPLIEGLCAQTLIIKDLRLSVVCVHMFCFFVSEEKIC